MTQNVVDYSSNPTGPELLDDLLDKEQKNILTNNSGIQRPSYAQAGTIWVDNSVNPWILNFYDGVDDVEIGTINPTTHAFISSNFANVVNLTTNQNIAGVKTFTSSPLVPTPTSGDDLSSVVNLEALNTKADTSTVVTLANSQIITGSKTFNQPIMHGDSNTNGRIDFYVNTAYSTGTYIDSYDTGSGTVMRFYNIGGSIGAKAAYFNFSAGTLVLPTSPAVGTNNTTVATTGYVNTKFQKVSALPASPDANTYYFIP